MKSIFRKWMFGLLLVSGAGLGSCSDDPDAINNELQLDRALMPLNFTASVLSTGNEVRLSWDVRKEVSYEVLFYADEGLTQTVHTVSDIAPADVPVTVRLDAEQTYYATVQAFSANERVAPSNLAIAGPIETYAIMDPLNPVVTERTATSVTLKWDQDEYVTHLLATPVASADGEPVRLDLTADQIKAGAAKIEGLKPSTQYTVGVYYNSAGRGSQDVWTRPDLSKTTPISTVEQLMQAFVDGGNYSLAYSETPYVVPEYLDGAVNPASTLAADLTIIGETTLEGAKPKIEGLAIGLNPGIRKLHLEDLALDGAGEASVMIEVKAAVEMDAVTVKNCDAKSYRNIFYENKAGSAIQTLLFDGVYAAEMGNSGGDFIDFRTESTHGSLMICNSTFYNGARSFLRVDAKETFGTVALRNNTFGSFSVVTDGNNKGILYVRGTAGTYEVTNNLFLNETGDNARFIANNNAVKLPTLIQANYFFDCADTFFTATTADGAVTQETALQNGGKVLAADPCDNSLRGKFYVVNDEIASQRIGDPRWWHAVAPVVPEQTELVPIADATVWNFSDTEAFEPQEVTATKILGNLRFIVNDEQAPMTVTDRGTISFSEASVVSVNGIPTNNALAFKVSVPGTVMLTPSAAGYNKHMEVIVGGTRYALPADGTQSKFGFGDISEETTIYICSCSPVELQALEWSLEVVSGGEPKMLETPVFATTDIPAVDQGSSQPVTVEWAAVPNAAGYEVSFNGKSETVESASYTIPAATVAALKAGSYELTVKAKAAEGSLNYIDSETAAVTIRVNGVLTAVTSAYTWNIADASAFPAGEIKATSIYGNLQFLVTNEAKPMTVEHSIGEQGEAVDRIKFGGKSTLDGVTPTHRGLALRVGGNGTLTLKAVSSSSSDAAREVGVSANGKEYLREACPVSAETGESKTVVFDDLTGETTIYIYCYNTINVYALSWEPGGGDTPQPPVQEYTMTITKDALADIASTLPKDKASMQALTAPNEWMFQGVGFSSVLALSNASAPDGGKLPVLYLYKKGTHTTLDNFIANTTSLGTINTITVTLMDGAAQKGEKFTMTEMVDGVAQQVLSTNETTASTEHVYTFDARNDGTFTYTNGGGSDCKISSLVIVYEK